jgi:hypothetical protein
LEFAGDGDDERRGSGLLATGRKDGNGEGMMLEVDGQALGPWFPFDSEL